MQSWFSLELDGRPYRVEKDDTHLTLAQFLVQLDEIYADFSFGESWRGGCPVIVGQLEKDAPRFRLNDATLLLMPQLAGRQVWTPQGISNSDPNHPVNIALSSGIFESGSKRNGSLAAALFEGFYRPDLRRRGQMNDQFDSLVTRSLNVPSVRDAAARVFASVEQVRHEAAQKAEKSGKENQVWTGRKDIHEDRFSKRLFQLKEYAELNYVDGSKRRFYRPKTLVDLMRLKREYPEAQLIAGGTGLAQDSGKVEWPNLISVEGVDELNEIITDQDYWEIGSAVSLTRIAETIGRECPEFAKLMRRFGSRPVRNRATLGGYLATAWSQGQLSPLLIALNARVMLLSNDGERNAPVSQFFDKNGGTILQPGEIVRSVVIPRSTDSLLDSRGMTARICDAYSTGQRRNLVDPFVTGAFALELREKVVAKAWIAYSGLGKTPVRIKEAEEFLAGKTWNEDTMHAVLPVLHKSAGALLKAASEEEDDEEAALYRKQLVITLFQKFYYQHPDPDSVKPKNLSASNEIGRLEQPFFDAITPLT